MFIGQRFSATASGATDATATISADPDKTYYITDISASSDTDGSIITVKQGTTIIWEAIIKANTSYEHRFGTPLVGEKGASVSISVSGGTSVVKANLSGFSL